MVIFFLYTRWKNTLRDILICDVYNYNLKIVFTSRDTDELLQYICVFTITWTHKYTAVAHQ